MVSRYKNLSAEAADTLRRGGVGVIPTDTLYGIVASAMNEEAVARVYTLKQRDPTKPCIILIASVDDLKAFDLTLTAAQREALAQYWPGPTSVSLPCGPHTPLYLHAEKGTLASRLPDDTQFRAFLAESGPLIAPSANPEGLAPATTVAEAEAYFGDRVDVYIDGGVRAGKASTLLAMDSSGEVTTLRP